MESSDSSEKTDNVFANTSSLEIISSAKLGGNKKKDKDVVVLHTKDIDLLDEDPPMCEPINICEKAQDDENTGKNDENTGKDDENTGKDENIETGEDAVTDEEELKFEEELNKKDWV